MVCANVHASCVVLANAARAFDAREEAAILILGESGSGKSQLALRLIERGALLLADDRTELFIREGRLWARAPEQLRGLMEIRNVGIVSLPFKPEAAIALAVLATKSPHRLPEPETYSPEPGLSHAAQPPLIRMDLFESAAPAKILAAAGAFAKARFHDGRKPQ